MNKKCITTVFTFLFFYVTVALVYAKSGHMYHKNLITFSCMLMQLLFLLYIWFIFPGWWLRKLAALSADTRHDTNISAANTRQYFVLLCYLLPFTYFREESICLHRLDFVIWVVLLFFSFFYFNGLQIFCIVWESFAFSKY